MGYDIYARTQPGSDEAVAEKAAERRRLLDEARAAGVGSLYESDHPLALASLAAGREEDLLRGHFRLNIWGMTTARDELLNAGVFVEFDHTPLPDHDCDDEDCLVCLQWVGQTVDGPGIPLFKVCSNDGWIINPIEIQSGLRMADEADSKWRDGLTDYVRDFVEYLESVAAADGCEVC